MSDAAATSTPASVAPATRLAGMHPAYFAVVMATGIVSLACHVVGLAPVARVLFAGNLVAYAVLWLLLALRVARHRDQVLADLWHHRRAAGFFTIAAATGVLGSQCLILADAFGAASALWLAGIALWAGISYAVFAILIVKPHKPALADGVDGGWLVAVVGGQSTVVLGAQLAPGLGAHAPHALLFCLAMWLGAGMLYLWIIGMIFYRHLFFPVQPAALAPTSWINMGAAAISTLAGASLTAAAAHAPLLEQLLPFVRGVTVLWWATASWWIPLLVVLGIWRHGVRKVPLRYDPLYWGGVFPLGMYAVATARVAADLAAPSLLVVSRGFAYVALAAWSAVAAAMLVSLFRGWTDR